MFSYDEIYNEPPYNYWDCRKMTQWDEIIAFIDSLPQIVDD